MPRRLELVPSTFFFLLSASAYFGKDVSNINNLIIATIIIRTLCMASGDHAEVEKGWLTKRDGAAKDRNDMKFRCRCPVLIKCVADISLSSPPPLFYPFVIS